MGKKSKRKVEVVIISDIHLGTYGSQAKALLMYLKSIKPQTLILNGDVFDGWQFSKRYWPQSHMQVIKHIIGLVSKGVAVHYITGNHDEVMRKFTGLQFASFSVSNKMVLELDGKKAWVFHGDVFDVTMQHSKWLARLGAVGYGSLIVINKLANFLSEKLFKKGKLSLSKRIKDGVSQKLKEKSKFEATAAELAIENGYDYVVLGHIHMPEMKTMYNEKGSVTYLNSGDWVENCTALEYNKGAWSIYSFSEDHTVADYDLPDSPAWSNRELFMEMMKEFNLTPDKI